MTKRLLILLLLSFLSSFIFSQNANVDSIQNLLTQHKQDDEIKVKLLNEMAFTIGLNNLDEMRKYTGRAIELADKLKFLKGKSESLSLMALYYHKSNRTLALDYFQKALSIEESFKDKLCAAKYLNALGLCYASMGNKQKLAECYQKADKFTGNSKSKTEIANYVKKIAGFFSSHSSYDLAIRAYQKALTIIDHANNKVLEYECYDGLANIFEMRGNYPLALEYYHKSLEIKEQTKDKSSIMYGLVNLSNIYSLQSNLDEALENIISANKIADELKDKHKISLCLVNIGSIYNLKNDPRALTYFQKSLKLATEVGDVWVILKSYLSMGDYYQDDNQNEKALENYEIALMMAVNMDEKREICELWLSMGAIFLEQKKYSKALSYSIKSLELADEMGLLNEQKEIHGQLSQIYEATNNLPSAYKHHKIFKSLSDSVLNEKNIKRLAEIEFTHKFDKEKQAAELEHQKEKAVHVAEAKLQAIIIYSLIGGLLLMFSLAVLALRSYRLKIKTNILLTKQKREIEDLNKEYVALNEELKLTNNQLLDTKKIVEERESLLTQITDNVPVFISLIDNDLRYLFANSGYAKIFGLTKNRISGNKVEKILDQASYQKAYPNILKTLEGERVVFENLLYHKDGDSRIVQTTYLPYYQNSKVEGVIVCSDDITERKRTEQALKDSEAEKDRLMALEFERIGSELEYNQKKMTAASLKLIQNSERDAQTIERLMEIEKNTNIEGKQKINTLIADYKRISYNSNWDEFEILFEKVHHSFYEKLNVLFPKLTANERKICAFLKLNMTNKDIAQITFQSDDALKKARLRLRQKLGICRETNLVAFLQNI